MVRINKQDFLSLKTLLEEGSITKGKLKNKELVEGLKQNGAVVVVRKTPSRYTIKLRKYENVFLFLQQNNYNISYIEEIESYIEDVLQRSASRDTLQKYHSNTKAKSSPSLTGLYVASLENIEIKLDDEVVNIPPQNGMGHFLFYTQKIELFEDTIIVGVENYQIIWFAQKYSRFFEGKKVLFVFINAANAYPLQWIEDKENEYIHFGDYDLAGVNIYLNKVLPRLKKAKSHSMLIPNNIEELLSKSKNSDLYRDQIGYKNLITSDEKINNLIKLIHKYKRGFEQEGLSV